MRGTKTRFNLLLGAALFLAAAGVGVGVQAAGKSGKPKRQKVVNTVRIYVESRRDLPDRTLTATIGPGSAIQFQVEKLPILNEVHVTAATLTDQPGGFQVELKFNTVGARILENYTATALGRHLAVMTEIDEDARWIAAPLIRRRLGEGSLAFAPNTTREEADRLVRGLNETIEKNRRRWLE